MGFVDDETLQQMFGIDFGQQVLQWFWRFELLWSYVKELDYVTVALASDAAEFPVSVARLIGWGKWFWC
jgi:hypothetical protein